MARKLSIDLPNRYYNALSHVARAPGMVNRLAVYAIAGEEEVFQAGGSRGNYPMYYDTDYQKLREHPDVAPGYEPNLRFKFESIVQLGHVGCLIIYDDRELRLDVIRKQVEQLLADESQPPEQLQAS